MAPAPKRGGTLTIGVSANADTLDPHLTTSLRASRYNALIYDNLVNRGYDGTIQPGLAESWTVSPDGQSYTFTLRQDATWLDGSPVTSADVKWTFERWQQTANSPTRNAIQAVGAIDTPNQRTVILRLTRPQNTLPGELTSAWSVILNRAAVEQAGQNYGKTAAYGSGPYAPRELNLQRDWFALNRPGYASGGPAFANQGPAYLDGVEFRITPDNSARVAAFLAGETLILGDVPPQDVPRLTTATTQVITYEQGATTFVGFNTKHPILSDVRVRQALQTAINVDEILKTAYAGLGKPANNIISPAIPDSWQGANTVPNKYNLALAKQLLDEAGWTAGSDGIRAKGGTKLSFRWLYNTNDSTATQTAKLIESQAANVGIKLDSTATTGEQGAILNGVSYEDASVLRFLFHTSQQSASNRYGYGTPQTDALLDTALASQDKAAVTKAYQDFQAILAEQVPVVPLVHPQGLLAVSKRVQGIRVHASRWLYKMLDLWLA